MAKIGSLTKVCKIKLYLFPQSTDIEEDKKMRNEMYSTLLKISWEARQLRHNTLKRAILYNFLESENPHAIESVVGKRINKKGKRHIYSTFLTLTRPNSKLLTETQASWIQTEVEIKFKNELKEYNLGRRAYPAYRDLSIIVKSKDSDIQRQDKEYVFYPSELRKKGYIFGFTGLEADKSASVVVERILSGDYGISDSRIVKDKNDGLWYLYLSYNLNPVEKQLNPDIICGVDLGWVIPAYCGLNVGMNRKALGNSAEIKRFREQIKNRRRWIQKGTEMRSGHGRKRKFEALEVLSGKEKNWVQTYNHKLSKKVIDFCVQNNAGTIHLEALDSGVKKSAFLTAYWSYYQLQSMIENNAKMFGIKVKYIDPAYTSQSCPACGHIARDNRPEQYKFKCAQCQWPVDKEFMNADYVASINIARSKKFVKRGGEENQDNENYVSDDISPFSPSEEAVSSANAS